MSEAARPERFDITRPFRTQAGYVVYNPHWVTYVTDCKNTHIIYGDIRTECGTCYTRMWWDEQGKSKTVGYDLVYIEKTSDETEPKDAGSQEKSSSKQVSEWQVIQSDRVSLMHEANTLVNHLIYKQIAPTIMSGIGSLQELSTQEEATYNEALKFLQRQFFAGHVETEKHLTKAETESEVAK